MAVIPLRPPAVADLPASPGAEPYVVVPLDHLQRACRAAAEFLSKDPTRPTLRRAFLSARFAHLQVHATDGHTAFAADVKCAPDGGLNPCLLSEEQLLAVARVRVERPAKGKKGAAPPTLVRLSATSLKAHVSVKGAEALPALLSFESLPEGEGKAGGAFPDLGRVIPEEAKANATGPRVAGFNPRYLGRLDILKLWERERGEHAVMILQSPEDCYSALRADVQLCDDEGESKATVVIMPCRI